MADKIEPFYSQPVSKINWFEHDKAIQCFNEFFYFHWAWSKNVEQICVCALCAKYLNKYPVELILLVAAYLSCASYFTIILSLSFFFSIFFFFFHVLSRCTFLPTFDIDFIYS